MSRKFPPLPREKFKIIYADPPWDYQGRKKFSKGKSIPSVESHYDLVELKDLKKLKVQKIAADACLLFMWTSSPHLDQAIELATHWGFKYTTVAFVWDKQRTNPGYYTLSQCELCLVFKKGKIPQPRKARNIRQFVQSERTKHSKKPREVRERIHKMFPYSNKIELFARRKESLSWKVWGNEAG